jgi:glycosyltransferase involved in cell wall biosynthesis
VNSVALLNPSVHDQSPTIVLQALALGVPVIALDLAGPALQLTAECGFLIEAGTPQQAIGEMASAMSRLVREPDLRRSLGEAGIHRVRECFTWETQAQRMDLIYREALGLAAESASPIGRGK